MLLGIGVGGIVIILAAVVCGLLAAWFVFGLMERNGNQPNQAPPIATATPAVQAMESTIGATPSLIPGTVPETSPTIFLPLSISQGRERREKMLRIRSVARYPAAPASYDLL